VCIAGYAGSIVIREAKKVEDCKEVDEVGFELTRCDVMVGCEGERGEGGKKDMSLSSNARANNLIGEGNRNNILHNRSHPFRSRSCGTPGWNYRVLLTLSLVYSIIPEVRIL